jgi:hypothetical protein
MKPAAEQSTAICILGMHRSGTSSITRAINLLGAYLGEAEKLCGTGADNPKGHWEHLEIQGLQRRLLARLGREWNTTRPLPDGWCGLDAIRPLKAELAGLVGRVFAGQPLWAWKDPQTCLLVPLWREILRQSDTQIRCVFVVRNPLDVANSLAARNGLQLNHSLGIWFHYNIVALKDAAGLPTVFLSYEGFLGAWEPELRRCASELGLNWPPDTQGLRAELESFIEPGLRHNHAPPEQLQKLPLPVLELYQILSDACVGTTGRDDCFDATASRLWREFRGYGPLFEPTPTPPKEGRLRRTWRRWQRSIGKRMSGNQESRRKSSA